MPKLYSSFRFPRLAFASSLCLILTLPSLLSGCSHNGAYVDRRRDAGHDELTYVGDSTPDAPSICYNTMTATPQQVSALAMAECAKTGRVAAFRGQSSLSCTLFYPTRAKFLCVPPNSFAY